MKKTSSIYKLTGEKDVEQHQIIHITSSNINEAKIHNLRRLLVLHRSMKLILGLSKIVANI